MRIAGNGSGRLFRFQILARIWCRKRRVSWCGIVGLSRICGVWGGGGVSRGMFVLLRSSFLV